MGRSFRLPHADTYDLHERTGGSGVKLAEPQRPNVIDKIGFGGRFGLRPEFVPDETTPEMPSPPGSELPGTFIFQALRQRPGLQLESTKPPLRSSLSITLNCQTGINARLHLDGAAICHVVANPRPP